MSQSFERPRTTAPLLELVARLADRQRRHGLRRRGRDHRRLRLGTARAVRGLGVPVDHRRAGSRLRQRRVGGRPFGALAADEARRDPEDADLEVVVGVELDVRLGQEHVALAACVLGEVVLELLAQLLLVVRELLAVRRREVDRVLVRDVDARDRDAAVVVHLLDELARELDRLDVGPEGAAEHPLEQGLELRLDAPEDAHGRVGRGGGKWRIGRVGTPGIQSRGWICRRPRPGVRSAAVAW